MADIPAVRVAVVNDYELIVTGLASVLEPFSDDVTVVELDSGVPVLSDVDVLLYDTYGQPQGDAIDVDALVATDQSVRLVVFSWNTDEQLIKKALAAGAAGYVSKSASAEQLVTALRDVHAGKEVVVVPDADSQSSAATNGHVGRWPGDHLGLSPRESEVLALVCQGLSNQEITERAFIGINTVKTHIRTLYRKIGVESRSQAVAWGMRHGFEKSHTRELPDS
jgi:two-component system, NarL family, response regulator LiaR